MSRGGHCFQSGGAVLGFGNVSVHPAGADAVDNQLGGLTAARGVNEDRLKQWNVPLGKCVVAYNHFKIDVLMFLISTLHAKGDRALPAEQTAFAQIELIVLTLSALL